MGEHIGHMAAKGMDGWGKPGIRKRKADVLTNRTIIINTRWQQLIAIRTLHLLHSLINQPHWKLFIRNTLIYNRPMTINHPWNAHRSSSISGSGTLQAALANAVLLLWNALPAFTGIRQTVGATGICVYLYFCGGSLDQTSIIVNYLQPWAETPSGRLQGGGEQQYVSYTGVHMVLSSRVI